MISNKTMLHRLLYSALIEIREEAYTTQNAKIFHLADLFHNLPLRLTKSVDDYDEIMEGLNKRAAEKGIEKWLENRVEEIKQNPNTR